ncbi:unnamed protein product [Hyaloperonospora brassicae]|uniref:Trypsin-like cysteine/serine peptidase domain-containing protein n=1 Tax=Hyaloperonospora brassicae TaxID=162125 RepID=A0AAV0U4T8_HYABA|nr:unnamed protein product [Hyaloperonospora brassicae]
MVVAKHCSRRAVLSLTTRFYLPHEGMTTLDYLSSGSALVLHGSSSSSLAVVTCQHVACPWLFPRYFSTTWDWLQFVNENHVRHSLQLLALDTRNSSVTKPEVLLELPLASQVHTHHSRDLALLTLADSAATKSWHQAEHEFNVQALSLDTAPCEQGDDVVFFGHRRVENEVDESYQVPMTVAGQFVGRSSSGQAFARSQELLEEGMCGGAVVRAKMHKCVGIVEGIVPMSNEEDDKEPSTHDRKEREAWQMRRALAGHVALIPSRDVKEFIDEPGNLLLTGMEVPPYM